MGGAEGEEREYRVDTTPHPPPPVSPEPDAGLNITTLRSTPEPVGWTFNQIYHPSIPKYF